MSQQPSDADRPADGNAAATPKAGKQTAGTKRAPKPTGSSRDPLRRSRTGGFYLAVIGLGVGLVLLTIFIVQNTETTTVTFLGLQAQAPVAVLLLIAVAAGIFVAGTAASLRIMQLRRRIKHDRKS